MRSNQYQLQCHTCHFCCIGQTGRCLEQRYKEHTRYTTSSNPQSAYALHVLHHKHEYGPMNVTKSVLHPAPKCRRMNSLGNFYIQLFQRHNTVINEQSEKDKIPFLISITTYHWNTHEVEPHSFSPVFKVDFSTVWPADTTTSPYLVRNILTTILTYSLQYTILFINILITSYTRISFISGWRYDAHNTETLTTHVN